MLPVAAAMAHAPQVTRARTMTAGTKTAEMRSAKACVAGVALGLRLGF